MGQEAKAPTAKTKASAFASKSPRSEDPNSPEEAPASYATAIRYRDYPLAWKLIRDATEQEQKTPEVRYAEALVALKLDDVEGALRAVNHLEDKWPAFKKEAEAVRLAAAKQSRDVTLLTHFLGSSQDPSDLLLLAEANENTSSAQDALKVLDQVLSGLSSSKRTDRKSLEGRARVIKARALLAQEKSDLAAKEYRWLATEGVSLASSSPALVEVLSAADEMKKLDPRLKLSTDERLQRAEAFSELGLSEELEQELKALKQETTNPPPSAKTDALLAWALYIERSDYERSSELFRRAASHGGPDQKKNLYYEAKALARSHRDAEAIVKYEALATLGGTYAEHAAYQAARLRFTDGQWAKAVSAYESYLKRYGKSAQHRSETEYDLPIARLAAGQFKQAEAELSQLIKLEDRPRERAQLMELRAVALLGQGKHEAAERLFREVIEYQPLSYAALLAAARLRAMVIHLPPLIPPARSLPPKEQVSPALQLSLPDKVWRLSRVGLDEEAESALQKEEAAIKAEYGSRAGEALCRLYGQLESARRRYQIAQTAASWSSLSVAPSANTKWQWECIYPKPYAEELREQAERRDVPGSFIYGVMRQESAFRPTVVSPAQAVGLMQIIPPTATRIAEEISAVYDPELMRAPAVNIRFGTYYLRKLLDTFGQRYELAAASYNAGPQAVTRWLRAGETLPIDLFVARIPYAETREYVYRVMGNYARYAYLEDPASVPVVELNLPAGLKATSDAY